MNRLFRIIPFVSLVSGAVLAATPPASTARNAWTEADKNVLRAKLDEAAISQAFRESSPVKLSMSRIQEVRECILKTVWETFPGGGSTVTPEALSATIRVSTQSCFRGAIDRVLGASVWTAEFETAFESLCNRDDTTEMRRKCRCVLRQVKKRYPSPAAFYAVWTEAPSATSEDRAKLERTVSACAER